MKLIMENWRKFLEKDTISEGFFGRAKNKIQRTLGREVTSGKFVPYPEGKGNWVNISVPYYDADIKSLSKEAILFTAIVDKLHEELNLKEPTVTSGHRDPERQARAMFTLWKNNGTEYLQNLYTDCKSCAHNAGTTAQEIAKAFESTQDPNAAIAAAASIINSEPISAHNYGKAVDYRMYGHQGSVDKIIATAFERGYVEGEIIDETGATPPHWHVTVQGITQDGRDYLNIPNKALAGDRETAK